MQPPSRWKVLVVDSFTQSLLNSVLKLNDILQQNVSTVENIEHNRQPQASFEACYLLTPTSANVERIIRDLAPPQGRPQQYAAGHIFFVDALTDQLLQKLTSSPAEPYLRQLIEVFTNFWPIEAQTFSLKSPQSFFNLFQPIGGAYGPDQSEATAAVETELFFATQTLLNVCVTLNEFPLIRYYNPQHPSLGPLAPVGANEGTMNSAYGGSARLASLGRSASYSSSSNSSSGSGEHFTKKLAMRLQQTIDDYVRDNEPKSDAGRPRGVLFITDRTMDTIAPLLHEFSYQAMANDLLPIEDGSKYHYRFQTSDGQKEDKNATLSDDDAVWTGNRHLHIAEAIDKLSKDFQAHAGEAGAFADNNSSLNDMRDMLASLPHMQETKDKLSLHLTMAQDCMAKFENTRLPQQAMVEQNCATRLTPEGQKPRTLVEEMVPLLDDRSVSNVDKVRIIALYIMYCEGVNDEDRKRLFQHARLTLQEMDAVNNLVHLGAQVLRDPSQNSAWDGWFRRSKRRQQPGDNEYELSRYQPLVKLMVEDHFAGKLDQTTYPYVRDAPLEVGGASGYLASGLSAGGRDSPLARVAGIGGGGNSSASAARPTGAPSSLRSAKPTWHQKSRGAGAGGAGGGGDRSGFQSGGSGSTGMSIRDDTRQRVIVFVAGGMTYSEMRSVYQISQRLNKDGYIGSSHVFTPQTFVESLRRIGKATNTAGGAGGGSLGRLQQQMNGQGSMQEREGFAKQEGSDSKSRSNRFGIASNSRSPPSSSASVPSLDDRSRGAPQPPPLQSAPTFDQGVYDRRFGTAGPTSAGPPSTRPSPHHANTMSGPPSNARLGLPAGTPQTGDGGSLGSPASVRSGSFGTSSGASFAGSDKDKKKRLKNPFSFSKGKS